MASRPPARAIPVWIILLLYWGFLFYCTHLPAITIPLQANDKTAHYLAYGLLGGLLYLALWANNPRRSDLVFLVLVIGMCYGALDEWTQPLPWFRRTCDLVDWFADCAGLATADVGMTLIRRGLGLWR
jgi:VanZ family protein